MNYPKLQDDWMTEEKTLAFSESTRLTLSIRFDGNGNTVTRFIVNIAGKKTTYEKHDSAAEAYNIACKKIAS